MDVLAPELSADMQVPSGHCNGLSDWGQTTQSPARTLARMPVFPIPRKLPKKKKKKKSPMLSMCTLQGMNRVERSKAHFSAHC